MTVPNALILTPIRFDADPVIRVTANSVTTDVTIDITPGRDYWISGDAQADAVGNVNGEGDLLAIIAAAIVAGHAQVSACSFSINANYTLGISITSGGQVDFEFTHANNTLDATILGYPGDADVTDINGATSDDVPRGIWEPGYPISVDSRDRQPIVGGVAMTISGIPRVSRIATPLPMRSLTFDLLNQSKILDEYTDADEPYGSFEWNWTNAIGLGRNFRLYEDEADLTTGATYSVYRIADLADPLARAQQYNVFWSVTLTAALLEAK